jgi:DNA helicase HerA-like ATPase
VQYTAADAKLALPMQDFEKLGQFYLGRRYDLEANRPTDELLLYDSKDLVTHALCLGMTGSGKTGLCLALIEEAAIDGVPALIVDPKGDLGNLLLTFPDLAPEDFAPWVDEDEARRKGKSRSDFAAEQAALWKAGLASWGQDGARIARLRNAAEFTIYTPGSTAGVPLSILKSFDDESEGPPVYGRNRGVLSARGQSSIEGSSVDLAQTGTCIWSRDRSRYSEFG